MVASAKWEIFKIMFEVLLPTARLTQLLNHSSATLFYFAKATGTQRTILVENVKSEFCWHILQFVLGCRQIVVCMLFKPQYPLTDSS